MRSDTARRKAAIAAGEKKANVLLVDKGNKLGRKLAISGGGRCNVTNAKPLPELIQNIPGNGRFLYSALTRFSNEDVRTFFEGLGIRLKEEDRGRVFPVTDRAQTVVDALVQKVKDCGVQLCLNTPVAGLWLADEAVRGVILHHQQRLSAHAVVVATGGCSVPKTGSTGDAYAWALQAGHTVVDPYPTAVPLTSAEPFIRDRSLQGLSLRDTVVAVYHGRKRLTQEEGDLLFTHFGLSGPVALRCSHYVAVTLRRQPQAQLLATVDCLPGTPEAAWLDHLQRARRDTPRRQLETVLRASLPDRLADVIARRCQLAGRPLAELSNAQLDQVTAYVKAFPIRISGTLPLAQATVTGGGVSVREVDPRSMASKKCRGLFFAGEVLDVHAHTGGYNITVAFSTGHLAGASAAVYALAARTHPAQTTAPAEPAAGEFSR
ncbi:MAG: NAD(P)/FAD-dependent oxidoreductase [Alicyclobacillus sp.]|nr:NAD(P)/FAD-dependent oxidoreductase [Alicyclobacillus sp.]